MNLKQLSSHELNEHLLLLVKNERKLLTEILWHLKEVDRRGLYLKMGYSSLFGYMTEFLGYSAASSQRRIDAARLLQEIPEVSEMLKSGALNLSQVSLVQQSAREARRRHGPTSAWKMKALCHKKKDLLLEIQSKNQKESQVIINKVFDLPIHEKPVIRHQANESVRVEITLSKEQWQKVEEMREILSQSVKSQDLPTLLVYLAEKVIQKKKGKAAMPSASDKTKTVTSVAEVRSSVRKPVPARIRQQVFSEINSCQYHDKASGKVCGERRFLQIEHRKPIWAGGDHSPENLTVLCANHNQFQYRQQSHRFRR